MENKVMKDFDENKFREASTLLAIIKSTLSIIDFIYGAIYIVLMTERGLTPLEISTVFAFSTLFLFIFDYPSGSISDKYGRKKVAGIGIIVWGLSFIFFLVSKNLIDFIIASTVLQLGIALVSGNFQSWYYDISNKYNQMEYRIKFLIRLGIITQVFSILGALIGSMILLVGIDILYVCCSIVMMITGVICLLLSEDNHSKNSENMNLLRHLYLSTKEFLKSDVTKKMIPFQFFISFSFFAFILGWQLYFINSLKMSKGLIGVLLVVFMISMLFGGKISEILHNKKGAKINSIILISFIFIIIGFLILTFVSNNVGFFIAAIFVEIGIGAYNNVNEIWIQDIIPSENRSTFFSGLGTFQNVFVFFLSMSIGWIIEYMGYELLWGISAIFMILNYLYFNKYLRRMDNK